jgi:hypothetical protein
MSTRGCCDFDTLMVGERVSVWGHVQKFLFIDHVISIRIQGNSDCAKSFHRDNVLLKI